MTPCKPMYLNSVRGGSHTRATIGLDYGTHSTKVVCRKLSDDCSWIVPSHDSHPDFCLQTTPSFMRIIGENLYFGGTAYAQPDGGAIGSLKAVLQDSVDETIELQQEVDELTVCFLAWVLQGASDSGQLPRDRDYVIQLSVPTSQNGNAKLVSRYKHIVQAVYRVWAAGDSAHFRQGVSVTDARALARRHLQVELESESSSRSFVLPETIAPVVSLQLEPYLKPGIYLIADMGASTTELTVCAVLGRQEERVLIYSDQSLRIGGLDLEQIDNLPVARSEEKLDVLRTTLTTAATRVWYEGYEIDYRCPAAQRLWRELTILLSGGATHHRDVAKTFGTKVAPQTTWLQDAKPSTAKRHHPSSIAPESISPETDLSLFATANGLSVFNSLWPTCFERWELSPLLPPVNPQASMSSYLEFA